MTNYKEMYLIMARATEKAIRILIEAQQTCEELAMAEDETDSNLRLTTITPKDVSVVKICKK